MNKATPTPAAPLKLGILAAFPYMDARTVAALREHAGSLDFFLDSGAFTAWKSGKPVSLDAYCRFIEAPPVPLWRYVMLDVIYNPVDTLRNLQTMRARGFNPVPVFTPGQSLTDLPYYYEGDNDFIACGGLANKYTPKSEAWLQSVKSGIALVRPDARLHLLGYTSFKWIKHHRPYSCDSSTWVNGTRYGAIHLWMGSGTFRILTKGSTAEKLKPEFAERIRALGVDPYALRKVSAWRGSTMDVNLAHRINIRSWLAASVETQRMIGTRIFLAGGGEMLKTLLDEYRAMRETGAICT